MSTGVFRPPFFRPPPPPQNPAYFAALSAVGPKFDAASSSGYQTAQSTYSWSHTCTGSSRFLSVGISMLSVGGSSVVSITYNGAALSLIRAKASVTGAIRAELWGLVAPAAGNNTIVVTLSTALDSIGNAVSFSNVNQFSSYESINDASATNVGAADATVDVTTVADNDLVVDLVATDDTAITVGAGQTSRNNVTGTLGSGAMSTEGPIAPPASVTMSWSSVGAVATWSIVSIALRSTTASSTVDLTPSLFTDTDVFFTPVVSTTYSVAPDLFVDTDTFFTPVVTTGVVNLSPSLFTDSDVFFTPVVTRGAVDLTPSLFTDTDVFFTPVVTTTYSVAPDLFNDTDVFFTPVVTRGAVDLAPSLFTDTDVFFTPVVTRGAVDLTPSLFTDTDVFFSAEITTGTSVQPPLFTDTDVFFTPVVTRGAVTLTPSLFTDTDTFYAAQIDNDRRIVVQAIYS